MTLQASPDSEVATTSAPGAASDAPADGLMEEPPDAPPKAYRVKSRQRELLETVLPPIVLGLGFVGFWYYVSFVVIDESRRFLMRPLHDVVDVGFLDSANFVEMLTGALVERQGGAHRAGHRDFGRLLPATIMSQAKIVERRCSPSW